MSTLNAASSLSPFEFPPVLGVGASGLADSDCGAELGLEGDGLEMAAAARSRCKRAIDVIGAIGGLIFLGPLMLIVALLVRLDSPGPALFRQVRLGRGGRPFWCLKFRTMATDAERRLQDLEAKNEVSSGVLFKIRQDPRVTRLGRFLRLTSLDELPQLINVLRGEMSLVGPRPLQLRDCQRLEALDRTRFRHRLKVVPGLTGPWQVSGRSNLDVHDMLHLDSNYVNRWSIGTDLMIICRTVGVVLIGRGAC
ncbi:MAG: sugar transferase [Isosphaeraceae bacterium]